jgi:hypothetical protein
MDCPKCGGDMWDNRERKKNPKAPDFKCKDSNCDGVIWPPRGAKSSAPTRSAPKSSNGNDDRSNRIERQHSQEMAIRFVQMQDASMIGRGEKPIALTTDKLRMMIDWFQRDIGRLPEKQEEPHERDSSYSSGHENDEPDF